MKSKNISTILTIIGSVGVIVTGASVIAATLKIKPEEKDNDDLKIFIKKHWKNYIPSAIICLTTIGCITGANIFNKKQQASIISAYALLNQSYKKYKDKVTEICGEKVHDDILTEIVKEECDLTRKNYAGSFAMVGTLTLENDDEPEIIRTFYEPFSKRYFDCTLSKVIDAEYHINRNYMIKGEVSINDFYDFLGIPTIDAGDDYGWSIDTIQDFFWIDFSHCSVELDDGMKIIMIEYGNEPMLIDALISM